MDFYNFSLIDKVTKYSKQEIWVYLDLMSVNFFLPELWGGVENTKEYKEGRNIKPSCLRHWLRA